MLDVDSREEAHGPLSGGQVSVPTRGDHDLCGRHLLRVPSGAHTCSAPASRLAAAPAPPRQAEGPSPRTLPPRSGALAFPWALLLLGPACAGLSGTCHVLQTRHANAVTGGCCCAVSPMLDVWGVSAGFLRDRCGLSKQAAATLAPASLRLPCPGGLRATSGRSPEGQHGPAGP